MDHIDERTNWNWVSRDQAQTNLPFSSRNGQEKDGHTNSFRLPTVNHAKQLVQKSSSDNKALKTAITSGNCFTESSEQYKNMYIHVANSYFQRINEDHRYDKLLDKNSLSRQILIIGMRKIAEIEKRGGPKEIIKAIGQLASEFIDLSLKYRRTNGLLELFNEALDHILGSNKQEIKIKDVHKPKNTSPHISKCILEQYQPVSDDSSTQSSTNECPRTAYRLTDWHGDESSTSKIPEKAWIWSEKSKHLK